MVQTAGSVDVEELITYIKSHLIVAELKGVLKAIHLPTSGLKKALQDKLSESECYSDTPLFAIKLTSQQNYASMKGAESGTS